MLRASTTRSLVSSLHTLTTCEVVVPTDPDYDTARSVFFRHIDRRPAVIVRPETAADVASAIAVARDCSLPIAVRGGGHSAAGHVRSRRRGRDRPDRTAVSVR